MERLTKKVDGVWTALCEYGSSPYPVVTQEIIDRLAAYEDTGLTPAEVQQMRWIPDIGDFAEIRPDDLKNRILFYDGLCAAFLAAWNATGNAWWAYYHGAAQDQLAHAKKTLREQEEREMRARRERDLRKLKRVLDQELENPGDLKCWSEVLFSAVSSRIIDQQK